MSKAFTKEDDEIPERVGRKRHSSGLPPGAANYMTAEGARRLRLELEELEKGTRGEQHGGGTTEERIARLRDVLASASVVPNRETSPAEVLFGTTVIVRSEDGVLSRHCIVGVDETDLEPGWVSWQSPLAKSLLGAQVGQRVQLPDAARVEIVEIVP